MAKINKKQDFDNILQENMVVLETTESIKNKITILPRLRDFIPPLSEEEYLQLEDNIKNEGCRDALILWKQGDDYNLVDGHNRHSICTKYKLDFNILVKDFSDIEQVEDWMIANQLGKRNLTDEWKSYYRGKQYNISKNKQGGSGNNQFSKVENFTTLQKTSEKLAEEHKVSEKTIRNDEKYANCIDRLTQNNPALKSKILQKDLNIPKSFILDMENWEEPKIQKFSDLLFQTNDKTQALKLLNDVPEDPIKTQDYLKEKKVKSFELLVKELMNLGLSKKELAQIIEGL